MVTQHTQALTGPSFGLKDPFFPEVSDLHLTQCCSDHGKQKLDLPSHFIISPDYIYVTNRPTTNQPVTLFTPYITIKCAHRS